MRVFSWIRKMFSEFLWWHFYRPLFDSRKTIGVWVYRFGEDSFQVVAVKTLFFGKILYAISREEIYQNEETGESFVEQMARQGIPVTVKTIKSNKLEDLRNSHPALRGFVPEGLDVTFRFA